MSRSTDICMIGVWPGGPHGEVETSTLAPMVDPIESPSVEDVTRWHRTFAPRFFNHTWSLMDRGNLTDDEVDEMLAAGFAQRAHWYQVGEPRNRAIADWQVSRAALLAGYPDLSLRFGDRCLRMGAENDLGPFVLGFAHEALVRTAAAVDDIDTFEAHLLSARELALQITDDEERSTLEADLDQMTG